MNPANIAHSKHIRRENLPYVITWVLYYAWVIIFTTWWAASPLDGTMFSMDIRALLHAVNLISAAAAIFLLSKQSAQSASRIAASLLLISSMLFFSLPSSPLHYPLLLIFGISMGTLNSSILIPFVFRLNNTEKFYSVVGANLLISLLLLLREIHLFDITNGILPAMIFLTAGLAPILCFRSDYPEASPNTAPKDKFRTRHVFYVTICLNCLYAVLNKGIGKAFLMLADQQSAKNLGVEYYLGALLGCAVFYLIYARAMHAGLLALNITFSTFVIAMLLYAAFREYAALLSLSILLLGIGSVIGIMSMYYLLGVIAKKYDSIRYVRISVLFIGLAGGLAAVMIGRLLAASEGNTGTNAALLSAAVTVILLMFFPLLSRTCFQEEWSEDAQKPEIDNEHLHIYRKYGLTKRETEICQLFLEGYTMRQIAGILGLSYATVNTYQTSLYRKLNISSRTELFVLFRDQIRR